MESKMSKLKPKKQTVFTPREIQIKFNKKRNKVDILMEALDYMQQYNGRSKLQCIALAMNYELTQDDEGNEVYKEWTL
jgi:hypothetical protein